MRANRNVLNRGRSARGKCMGGPGGFNRIRAHGFRGERSLHIGARGSACTYDASITREV
ncbi:hypothetical protein BD414DRAFT_477615, partial [Trametes punicea]